MSQSLAVRDNAFGFRRSAGLRCAIVLSLLVFCFFVLFGLATPLALAEVVAAGDSEPHKLALLRTALEEAKLLPEPDGIGGKSDFLGHAVALSGDRALVGGVNLVGTGGAIVFQWNGSAWVEEAVLVPDGAKDGSAFGYSVSLDGTRALVGAPSEEIDGKVEQGSAYVFDFVDGSWVQTGHLSAADGATDDSFGSSVSLDGARALVGAPFDDIGANVNQGSASVFDLVGGSWIEMSPPLTAAGGAAGDLFGRSVSLYGDRALVGAPFDDIGGNSTQGSASVFDFVSGSWIETAPPLTAAGGAAGDQFGRSVSLYGDRALVGAPDDDIGTNVRQGSASVFDLVGGSWIETAPPLTAAGGATDDRFGLSVILDGDRALVGAPFDDIGGNGVQGSASVFDLVGGSWIETFPPLTAAGGMAGDWFGWSVSLDGNRALVGASFDDIGMNRDQGSASVFDLVGSNWTETAPPLTAVSGAVDDQFGQSVSLDSIRALVGAPNDDIGANVDQGSAVMFDYIGGSWTGMVPPLTAAGGATLDQFGWSVSLGGDRALVGAPLDETASVFDFVSGNWTETASPLSAAGNSGFDYFGRSVSLDGERALVGAPLDDIGSNGAQGSASVFELLGGSWIETAPPLKAADGATNDWFGYSVSLDGERALIGAPYDDIGGNTDQGSASVFELDGGTWTETAPPLTAAGGAADDWFGWSVSLDGERALVGALESGIGGNASQGSAFVFGFTGREWFEQAELVDPEGAAFSRLGRSVALDGFRALVGALESAQLFRFDGAEWQHALAIEAADGRPNDEFGSSIALQGRRAIVGAPYHDARGRNSGAAYIYRLPPLVGGTVGGLAGTGLVVQQGPGSEVPIAYDTLFSFEPDSNRGAGYEVAVSSQPTNPPQTCTVTNGSGTLGDDDVTDIAIDCVTDSAPIQGPSTIAASNPGAQFAPRVAWDPERERWLAVWDQDVEGVRRIVGRFINKEGFPVGSSFFISDDTVNQTAPDIAYDPLEEQYLVVWVREFSPTDNDLWIREVPFSGPEAGLPPRTLVQPTTSESAPALVYSPDQTEFFLIWQRDDGIDPPGIWGAPLGQPVPPWVITGMPIASDGTFARREPRVAWNELNQTYLVAYERSLPSAQSDVYASLVEPSGSMLEMDRGIAGFSGDEHEVDVAACGENWLVVWTGEQETYGDVFSRRVDPALDLGAIQAFGVDEVDNRYPAVACNPHNGDFFVAWQQYSSTEGRMIRGAFIDPEGSAPEPFRLSEPVSVDNTRPAVSVAGTEDRAYVIWEQEASGIEAQNLEGRWVRLIPSYGVGGTVDGLDGSGLILQLDVDQGQVSLIEPLAIAQNGPYAFLAEIDDGQDYEVRIDTHPTQPRQTCEIVNEQGTINGASVTNVDVTCTTNTYPVGGSVSGLEGSGLVLRNNGGDDLAITMNGNFAFPTEVPDQGGYSVSVASDPTNPRQTCMVSNPIGTVDGAPITSVTVSCTTNTYPVGGTVTGLQGSGLVLRNNAGDDLPINMNGSFVFPTEVPDQGNYFVTVASQPSNPSQTCSVLGKEGSVDGGPVTDVTVSCAEDTTDLAITKANGQIGFDPGDVLIYEIAVTNNGPLPVEDAVVQDFLPPELLNASWTCTPDANASCPVEGVGDIDELVDLEAGASLVFVLTAETSPSFEGTIVNVATVAPPPGITDPVAGNNEAVDQTSVDPIFRDRFEQ